MKITVDAKSFADSLQWSIKSLDAKNEKAYVALVVSEEGKGFLSHENQSSYMKSPFTVLDVDLDGKSTFELPLAGSYISRLASSLDWSDAADLEFAGGTLTLTSKAAKFTLPTLNLSLSKEPTWVELGEVTNGEFFEALQRLSRILSVGQADLMPALGAVDILLDAENEKVVLMGTDRFVLSETALKFEPTNAQEAFGDEPRHILLPQPSAALIGPSKDGLLTTLLYEEKSGKFGYTFADGRVALFSLPQANPIAYEAMKAKTKSAATSATVDTAKLKKIIGTVSNLAWEEEHIWFDITSDNLVVRDAHKTNFLELDADTNVEEKRTVKFLRETVNRAFHGVVASKVTLRWEGDNSFFLFDSLQEDGKTVENVFTLANSSV